MFRQKTYKFSIRGDEWKIVVLNPSIFNKKHGDCEAIMDDNEKYAHFKTDEITEKAVRHELFHIFCSYLYHNSAKLTVDQFEESVAELLENHLDEYYKLSTVIYNKIAKHKTEKSVDNNE